MFELYVESRKQNNGVYRNHQWVITHDWEAAFDEIRAGYVMGEYTHEYNIRRVGKPWPRKYDATEQLETSGRIASYGREN